MTELTAGLAAPLGAHYDGEGINFTLYSAHAERVELCLFDGQQREVRLPLPARSGDIWHGYLPAGRGNVTVTGSTARLTRRTDSVSTPTNWRSIQPRARWKGRWGTTRTCTAVMSSRTRTTAQS
jgi:pullulanase/glycogen debranching enzyme